MICRCIALALLLVVGGPAARGQETLQRTIADRADLSGAEGMEVISSILVVPPGATIPRHFHHGIEAGIVLEGGTIQTLEGQVQELPAGTTHFQLRGVFHGGVKVLGEQTLRLYAVHIVDKDKPLLAGAE